MNDAIVLTFSSEPTKERKDFELSENNKSENEALGNVLENDGYPTLVVDSDQNKWMMFLSF